ncbi:hypothetical protein B0A54_01074 [Friedmanniomyces endolithicus]|uniref:Uncharacterized protein n=1 Tax=Friedmanniomyces endolithicus TaxID=329885 RepID=A0A4U0VIP4_9PEZI|nr:hypothetical protein LTS09_009064 [Friedmanniomyces endolithicus]TKA48998.1 hypothetical protein B0A54_01074 [Friedmanniomyces endolithicus]
MLWGPFKDDVDLPSYYLNDAQVPYFPFLGTFLPPGPLPDGYFDYQSFAWSSQAVQQLATAGPVYDPAPPRAPLAGQMQLPAATAAAVPVAQQTARPPKVRGWAAGLVPSDAEIEASLGPAKNRVNPIRGSKLGLTEVQCDVRRKKRKSISQVIRRAAIAEERRLGLEPTPKAKKAKKTAARPAARRRKTAVPSLASVEEEDSANPSPVVPFFGAAVPSAVPAPGSFLADPILPQADGSPEFGAALRGYEPDWAWTDVPADLTLRPDSVQMPSSSGALPAVPAPGSYIADPVLPQADGSTDFGAAGRWYEPPRTVDPANLTLAPSSVQTPWSSGVASWLADLPPMDMLPLPSSVLPPSDLPLSDDYRSLFPDGDVGVDFGGDHLYEDFFVFDGGATPAA